MEPGVKPPIVLLALVAAAQLSCCAGDGTDFLRRLRTAPAKVVLWSNVPADPGTVKIERLWKGSLCRSRLRNTSSTTLRIARVDLFDLEHGLAPDTPMYGEAFQMLGQTGGTLAHPEDWGSYADRSHYKLEEPEGLRTVHGLLLLHPAGGERLLLGFSSCRRFDGRFSFNDQRLLVSLDCEGLELAPGQIWKLEEFIVQRGTQREALLDALCQRVNKNQPRRKGFRAPPTGWCSWYCFGPGVTAQNIRRNLDWIAANAPQLRYIQIDDGYQPWMGDWLETGKSFGGDIKGVLKEIRRRGFEPAIWVAPFVASPQSKLFREHPDWFMRGEDGKPLRSDEVGFGGWRLGPWYALDGTHPEARAFLTHLFHILRHEYGCTYFKLDAVYWGALHLGRLYDPHATRIEAYRRGMEAIRRGAGDAFVLGCNHPMWPSLGLLDGARSSMDISRDWASIRDIGRQNLLRGWQNGRFWWNDPDCLLLSAGPLPDAREEMRGRKGLPANEVLFHAATVHATGGMLLSGDDLTSLGREQVDLLHKMLPPTAQAARFADEQLTVGRISQKEREWIYLFNWADAPAERVAPLGQPARLRDYWTGQELGTHTNEFSIPALPPHTARVIEVQPAVEHRSSRRNQ
jgi:alpha-galactosidase